MFELEKIRGIFLSIAIVNGHDLINWNSVFLMMFSLQTATKPTFANVTYRRYQRNGWYTLHIYIYAHRILAAVFNIPIQWILNVCLSHVYMCRRTKNSFCVRLFLKTVLLLLVIFMSSSSLARTLPCCIYFTVEKSHLCIHMRLNLCNFSRVNIFYLNTHRYTSPHTRIDAY